VDVKEKGNDSTDRFFQAHRHVRIFSDSLQAVSDSLFYSGKDSIFQLFQQPILWSNNNQVTGDTIYLYTRNKKAERMDVFENGLLISKARENMFNQIRGNRLNGYFIDGVIDNMRAKGNAESVYYIEDDEKLLIGVNKANGDIIDMRFKDKELNRVVFINDVKGVMYPVAQFPEGEKLLRNFNWHEDKRPKTKFELFGN
jgi:lipopolysaccharide export system protein LptA